MKYKSNKFILIILHFKIYFIQISKSMHVFILQLFKKIKKKYYQT